MKRNVVLCGVWFFFFGSTMRSAAATPAKLLSAYKKEYAFLEATKRQLRKRLLAIRTEGKKRLENGGKEINGLQREVVALRARAEELADRLRAAKRTAEAQQEGDRLLEVLERAGPTVKKAGVKLTPAEDDSVERRVAMLQRAFTAAGQLIRRGGQVRLEKGSFFLTDGTQVDGTLVRIGGIATYGLSEKGAGSLAPAGQGRLKLWPRDAAASARALARGKAPAMVDLFIYESLEKAVHPNKEKSLLETVQAGGLIAWIIVAIGALAVLLILFRIVVLLGAGANAKRLLHRLEPLLERNEILAAQKICKRSHGACARVLGATLQMIHASRKRLEDTVSEAVLAELPRIERFGSAITVFAAVAPLLGLLGTVTGMISTFDVITEHGTGDPKLLSGGISEALITTQLGLCVAIPTLLVGTLLRGRARAIEGAMERAAVRVINLTHGREAATAGEGESGAAVQSNPRPSGGDEGTISDLETEESEAPRAAPGADGLVKEPA